MTNPKHALSPGDRYGHLTVIERAPDRVTSGGRRLIALSCSCDCGRTHVVRSQDLRSGHTTSCGCRRGESVRRTSFKDLTGQTFGRLTVLSESGRSRSAVVQWLCRCECGAETTVVGWSLRGGSTRSCGCLAAEGIAQRSRTHGHASRGAEHPLYGVWRSMIQRCTNPKATTFQHYGARGVTVCDRWLGVSGFVNFLADMGDRPTTPDGYLRYWSIDRIDNDRGYAPDNCRWASPEMQAANKARAS